MNYRFYYLNNLIDVAYRDICIFLLVYKTEQLRIVTVYMLKLFLNYPYPLPPPFHVGFLSSYDVPTQVAIGLVCRSKNKIKSSLRLIL
jgi:hypothetical protein